MQKNRLVAERWICLIIYLLNYFRWKMILIFFVQEWCSAVEGVWKIQAFQVAIYRWKIISIICLFEHELKWILALSQRLKSCIKIYFTGWSSMSSKRAIWTRIAVFEFLIQPLIQSRWIELLSASHPRPEGNFQRDRLHLHFI